MQYDFSASCVEVIFDFDTSCVEVGFSTSVQHGQKCGFENSAQVGQNYILPVDISLENVLTSRDNFSLTVEICLLKFRI